MSKKTTKGLSLIICLLLVFSISVFPPFSAVGAVSASARVSQAVDYATILTEPETLNGGVACVSVESLKDVKLYPGGIPFGVKFITEGVLVVGFCDVKAENKTVNPSNEAGLRINDRIVAVDGKRLSSAAELTEIVEQSKGKTLSVVYSRNGSEYSTNLTPAYCKEENCYKTGIYVKDNGAGIGTVTYIVPETLAFAGLGHGICDGQSGQLIPIQRGAVVDVTISGVVKGLSGTPGEVKGYFRSGKCGSLLQNTDCGVFGVYSSLPENLPSEPLSLGLRDEIKEGKAYIYSTLEGNTPQKYEIEISCIDRSVREGKCFTVKVIDPALLEKTGGIVQGMSGSPIIQNGKLVGAVTHVLINDPTTGYGIFIENMLNAAQMPMAKAS